MNLSTQQLRQFQTFGFVVLRQLLTPDEMEGINREFDTAFESWIPGGMNSGKPRLYAPFTDATSPFLIGLLGDSRFCGTAEQLISAPVLGQLIEGHYYMGDHIWHPIERDVGYEWIRFNIYPQLMHGQNGALRFLPGSQDNPLSDRMVRNTEKVFGLTADEVPSYVVNTAPGDVIIHNSKVWRAALNAHEYTRCINITYCEDPQMEDKKKAVIDSFMSYHQKFITAFGQGQLYSTYWRTLLNPHHQNWVQRIAELGVLNTSQQK